MLLRETFYIDAVRVMLLRISPRTLVHVYLTKLLNPLKMNVFFSQGSIGRFKCTSVCLSCFTNGIIELQRQTTIKVIRSIVVVRVYYE